MVSRLEINKGYDTLLDALCLLKKEAFMKHTKLLLIGTGDEQSKFDSLLENYHLKDMVIQKDFVYQTELVKYYNAFDVMIFPTKRKSESLGLVGLEAMACKTPLIACNLYGPREYACLLYTSVIFLIKKKYREKLFWFIFSLAVLFGIGYLVVHHTSLFSEISNLIKIFYFPIFLLFCKEYENPYINGKYLTCLLYTSRCRSY